MTREIRRLCLCAAAAASLAFVLVACSGDRGEEPDCVPATAAEGTEGVKAERFELGEVSPSKEERDRLDWCRACVMGPKGYASCQRVWARDPSDARESLRARAREKACLDSGFPAGQCPDSAVVGIMCKGDPPPPGTTEPGKALQNLHQVLTGRGPMSDVVGAAASDGGAEPGAPSGDRPRSP